MALRSLTAALCAAVVLAGAAPVGAGTATQRIAGVVQPTVGVAVDSEGRFVAPTGTVTASVTRERHGNVELITIVPLK